MHVHNSTEKRSSAEDRNRSPNRVSISVIGRVTSVKQPPVSRDMSRDISYAGQMFWLHMPSPINRNRPLGSRRRPRKQLARRTGHGGGVESGVDRAKEDRAQFSGGQRHARSVSQQRTIRLSPVHCLLASQNCMTG